MNDDDDIIYLSFHGEPPHRPTLAEWMLWLDRLGYLSHADCPDLDVEPWLYRN